MRHETSLGLVYDGWDEGMHQAFGCGVFGLVLQASSRSIFSTSCLILTLALLDFFLGGGLAANASKWLASIVLSFGRLGLGFLSLILIPVQSLQSRARVMLLSSNQYILINICIEHLNTRYTE